MFDSASSNRLVGGTIGACAAKIKTRHHRESDARRLTSQRRRLRTLDMAALPNRTDLVQGGSVTERGTPTPSNANGVWQNSGET